MNHEQPFDAQPQPKELPDQKQVSERAKSKRFPGSRAAEALLLATSLLASSHEAQAKNSHHRDRTHQHAPRKEKQRTSSSERISLNTDKDHGLEKEVKAAEILKLRMFDSEEDLKRAIESGELVDIHPDPDDGYVIDAGLGELVSKEVRPLYASLLPFAAEHVQSIASEFHQRFHRKLVINSAVRTKTYVDDLRKVNPLVAPSYTSTHLRGTTVDIAIHFPKDEKHQEEYRLTKEEQQWLSAQFLKLESGVQAQATIENAHYHVMFYPQMDEAQKQAIQDLDGHTERHQPVEQTSARGSASEHLNVSLSGHADQGMQQEIAAVERYHLKKYKDERELRQAIKSGELVELKPDPDDGYEVDSRLGEFVQSKVRHLYAAVTPFVAEQIKHIAKEFYKEFHMKLVITSAVRTKQYIDLMRESYPNTAQGYTSSHLTGWTVDIAYKLKDLPGRPGFVMPAKAQAWMDERLLGMEAGEMGQMTKEKMGASVYHLMFYPPEQQGKK